MIGFLGRLRPLAHRTDNAASSLWSIGARPPSKSRNSEVIIKNDACIQGVKVADLSCRISLSLILSAPPPVS
ncbi:hypothetical protein VTL71DRAFT_9981 [Oculimacula yallundae]|uniref:Uncharacterized protein n=1 Tax=Oculimacula yallundae TaxID=86028 RepID=A0ABR4BRF7_9HELO